MEAQRLGTWNWNLSIVLNEDWTKFSSPNMDIKNKNNIKVPRRQLNKSAQQDTERECLAPILHQRLYQDQILNTTIFMQKGFMELNTLLSRK